MGPRRSRRWRSSDTHGRRRLRAAGYQPLSGYAGSRGLRAHAAASLLGRVIYSVCGNGWRLVMVILTITRLTFLEAVRRRVALAALLLGFAFLVLYTLGFHFITHETSLDDSGPMISLLRNQVYNFLTNAGLYAVNFLAIAMAALVSAD